MSALLFQDVSVTRSKLSHSDPAASRTAFSTSPGVRTCGKHHGLAAVGRVDEVEWNPGAAVFGKLGGNHTVAIGPVCLKERHVIGLEGLADLVRVQSRPAC